MKKENLEKNIQSLEQEIEAFRTSGEADPEISRACEEFLRTTSNLRGIINKIQDLEFQNTMMMDISEEATVTLPKVSANYKNYQTKRKLAASSHALDKMVISPADLLKEVAVKTPVAKEKAKDASDSGQLRTRMARNYDEIELPKVETSGEFIDFATASIPIVKEEVGPIKAISKHRRQIRPIILKPLNQQKFAEQREKEFFTSAIRTLTDSEIETGLMSNVQFDDLDIVPFAKEVTADDIESALNTTEIVLPFVNKNSEDNAKLQELNKYVELEDEEIYSKHLEEIKQAA